MCERYKGGEGCMCEVRGRCLWLSPEVGIVCLRNNGKDNIRDYMHVHIVCFNMFHKA